MLPVQKRFGSDWFDNLKFINLLPPRMKEELVSTVASETKKRRARPTQDQVIAALSFGFFQHLTGTSYSNHLWANGISFSFPHAPNNIDRAGIHLMIEEIRLLRNDVMHHFAVFDQRPQARYQTALNLASFICPDTHWFMSHLSQVSQVINDRPRA